MGQRLSLTKILQVRNLARQGYRTREIARNLGICPSLVYRIRQGRYRVCQPSDDDAPRRRSVWCPRCRCHIYPPCVACRARAAAPPSAHPGAGRAQPAANDPELKARLEANVAELGLNLRIINVLHWAGIETVGDLLERRPDDLRALPSFGERALATVYAALAQVGFHRERSAAPSTGGQNGHAEGRPVRRRRPDAPGRPRSR
jgi:hypothetical protein